MLNKKIIYFILAGLSVLCFLAYTYIKTPGLTHGFAAYYTFSKIALQGKDIEKSYDESYFHFKMNEYGFGKVKDYPNNIPTSSFMMMHLVWLSPVAAKIVWNILSVIFLFIAVILLLKSFDVSLNSPLGIMLFIPVFIFRPLLLNMVYGQAYVFLLFLFSLSVYGFKKNNSWLIAVPLALIFLFKGYAIYPVIFLLITKRWKETGIALGIIILMFFATLPVIHLETWLVYYEKVISVIGQDENASNVAYQTVNGFVRHCFAGFSSGGLSVLVLLVKVAAIIFLCQGYKRSESTAAFLFCAFIALNVILAPVAEEHHYVLFIPVIIILFKMFFENPNEYKLEIILSAIFYVILTAPYNYKSLQDSQFPVYLLAYLKLFSGIGLLVIIKKVISPVLILKRA